jgi:hypothetical protein
VCCQWATEVVLFGKLGENEVRNAEYHQNGITPLATFFRPERTTQASPTQRVGSKLPPTTTP